ncbi:amidohydrolase [Streptomyces stelliscabiei]|uniref:amidohydrolase n=1 Tax=Streptomyces stelliscabiei TaxID=146820 RepID=UPI0029BBF317|nr:amidohydrolase [Streptomyces stelliscabiei]MDX2555469.1 amidohydrolase [Streptomyces stelliscabiei]MDX2613987.1 amidohydrolase [Streptomyces stelliscabiei]MDX2639739.1 amidohydrolase [Streptomyces stelliscabiei]MDX2662454.1 amidohydrolase [Streptomyces stelliscabiei]MDX2714163.1 amidohydrolase [Streptomyces stelliscabiei]
MSDRTAPSKTVLLRGGEVHSPADPFATAMVVEHGQIAWVGSEGAADAFAADVDEVEDLEGALVTPAFTDAHVHTTATGLALTGLDLSGAPTLEAALVLVREFATARPADRVLLGHGWDAARWPGGRPPTRAELDEATGGRPLYLSRIDVHSAVVSSALLDLVPGAGSFEDGPLTRDAHHAVRATALGALTPAQRTEAQRAALAHAGSLGIGSVHECAGPEISSEDDFTGLLRLAAEEPGPRVVGYWAERDVDKARALGAVGAAGDLFVDGALGSHTACLHEPYADAAHTGTAYLDAAAVAAHVVACTETGLQAGFHAIGDAAVASVVEGVRAAAEKVGLARVRAARHRVEHVEMLAPESVAAFAELGLTASVQPAFDALWGGAEGMYAERLGPERARTLNPFAALLRAGVPLAFGSDSPVTPLDPWGTVRAAAFHRTPEHRVSVRAAFTAHTRGGWRAVGRDDAGVLVPGAPADYAVWRTGELVVQAPDDRVARWSTDPRSGTPGLPDLSPGTDLPVCLRTVVAGRTVFVRPGE